MSHLTAEEQLWPDPPAASGHALSHSPTHCRADSGAPDFRAAQGLPQGQPEHTLTHSLIYSRAQTLLYTLSHACTQHSASISHAFSATFTHFHTYSHSPPHTPSHAHSHTFSRTHTQVSGWLVVEESRRMVPDAIPTQGAVLLILLIGSHRGAANRAGSGIPRQEAVTCSISSQLREPGRVVPPGEARFAHLQVDMVTLTLQSSSDWEMR